MKKEYQYATIIKPVWSKNSSNPSCQTVFDSDGIPDWGGLLLSAGAAIARKYNPRPEQKLAHHTENTRHEDQLPSARSQPQPHGLPWSLDSLQQVIGENKETQRRRQFAGVLEFLAAVRGHGLAEVDQHTHGDARLDLMTVARSDPPLKLDGGCTRARVEPVGFRVEEIVLFRSHLRRPAPRYEPIGRFALAG